MNSREFVMHGQDGENWQTKVNLSDYCYSEKLDGVRGLWIPWTRGLRFQEVEFANRFKDHRDLICSGLWSRKAKIIHAPDVFLDKLPRNYILDGELFLGRGMFQATVGAVRKLIPIASEWENMQYRVFDIPTIEEFYSGGKIRIDIGQYIQMPGPPFGLVNYEFKSFEYVMGQINQFPNVTSVEMFKCPMSQANCVMQLETFLKEVFNLGGEGIMLRHRERLWKPKRCNNAIKLKDSKDAEGVVVGWEPGEGRLSGMMGSIVVDWKGVELKVSGFTDFERTLLDGKPVFFPYGRKITFKYRELSVAGVPKEPRYLRYHDEI